MDNEYKYMVATLCKTYNHAQYIEETLNGFAMQQTSFPCVYIVIDDASTDGEPEVLHDWANNNLEFTETTYQIHPFGGRYVAQLKSNLLSLFVIILLTENHHGKKSKLPYFGEWYNDAKYHAICEGDDYWINPQKLQTQVEYLNNHKEVGLVYSEINRYLQDEDRMEFGFLKTLPIKNTHVDFVLNSWFLAPCTWLWRVELEKKKPKLDSKNFFLGDTLMLLTFSKYSQLHYMDDKTSVYRVLKTSASHFSDYKKQMVFQNKNINTRIYFAKDQNIAFRMKFWWKVVRESRPPRKEFFKYGAIWIKNCLGYFIDLLFH